MCHLNVSNWDKWFVGVHHVCIKLKQPKPKPNQSKPRKIMSFQSFRERHHIITKFVVRPTFIWSDIILYQKGHHLIQAHLCIDTLARFKLRMYVYYCVECGWIRTTKHSNCTRVVWNFISFRISSLWYQFYHTMQCKFILIAGYWLLATDYWLLLATESIQITTTNLNEIFIITNLSNFRE